MKKILLSVITVCCFVFSAHAQDEGEIKFGAGINLGDITEAFGIQGQAAYGINEQFAARGAFTYWLEEFTDFSIDLSALYKGLSISDSFQFYPAAGLTYTKSVVNNTSLHIGAEFRFVLESGMTIYATPLLQLDTGSPLTLAAGILF